MLNSLSILNFVTATLGFVVASMLIFSKGQNRFVNFFLGVGFFGIAYRSLSNYALNRDLVENSFLMGSVSFIYYVIPVCIYLYFRSVVRDEQSLKKTDWLHFILPGMAFVLFVYYIIEGISVSGGLRLPVSHTAFGNITGFPFYIQPGVHAIVLFGMCLYYLIASYCNVFSKLKRKDGEHLQRKQMRVWIFTLLMVCSVLVVIIFFGVMLKLLFNIEIDFSIGADIMRSLTLMYIFTRVLFKPDLLYGLPDLATQLPVVDIYPSEIIYPHEIVLETSNNEADIPVEQEIESDKKEKPLYFDKHGWIHFQGNEEEENLNKLPASIEKDKVIYYIKRINDYLEQTPYTNENFDMKSISGELQAPLYHIEYLFRYYNKYSFSEFRNVMRVQYVLKELETGVPQNYTIEAIGLKAGFNSRSSFFRVFKTITGKTPKQVLDSTE